MNPLQTLLNWLAPLLNPLSEFHTHVSRLTTIHQGSVHSFDTLASGLMAAPAGSSEAFTGELATSFWDDVQAYLNAENALMSANTGTATALSGAEGIDAATAACQDCVSEITADATTAAAEITEDAALDEVTSMVDAAAVAEAGANPFADIAAIILTLVAGAALLVTLTKLGWDIYNAIQSWQRSMYRIGDTPLSQLPPNPTPVTAPEPSTTTPSNSTSLTPAQQRLLNDVKSRLGTATYNDADIEALILAGYLDPDTIAAIIKGGSDSITAFDDPLIIKMMNALSPADQRAFVKQAVDNKYTKDQVRSSLYQKSFDNLKNTGNFRPGAIDHIFKGANGGGYHYEGIPSAGGQVTGIRSITDRYGVYEAKVKINGIDKKGKGISTFFPRSMSPQDVVDSINRAYSSKTFVGGNTWIGHSSSGMPIQMFLDSTGKIISAFPLMTP